MNEQITVTDKDYQATISFSTFASDYNASLYRVGNKAVIVLDWSSDLLPTDDFEDTADNDGFYNDNESREHKPPYDIRDEDDNLLDEGLADYESAENSAQRLANKTGQTVYVQNAYGNTLLGVEPTDE